jgi:hypothetical protein
MSQVKPSDLDSVTITLSNDDYESNDSYMWSGSDTITLSDIVSGGSNTVIGGITVPWTTGTSISNDTYTLGPNWNNRTSGKIHLAGPDADIEVNGESLMGMLKAIEERLNILKPNSKLESEWAELKALGDAYRKLEADIEAKMKTWDAISK